MFVPYLVAVNRCATQNQFKLHLYQDARSILGDQYRAINPDNAARRPVLGH
jgi:hypothetical protein